MKKIIVLLTIIIVAAIIFKSKHIAVDEAVVEGVKESPAESTPVISEQEEPQESNIEEKQEIAEKDPSEILTVKVDGLADGKLIDPKYAYCVGKEDGTGENLRPAIFWNGMPNGTKSFAVIVVDTDVPTDFVDANKKGKIIPASQPRQDFIHFALINIPTDIKLIEEGAGKGIDKTQPSIGNAGINDYAYFMPNANKPEHVGWDGPCPPWNDEKVHNYHFKVYALKVKKLDLQEDYSAKEAYQSIKENAIEAAEIVGVYTRNK